MSLLRYISISPLSNWVIAQPEFSLTFTAHQELIRRSNFCADISPAHIVCSGQQDDHVIFCVFYCIAYLNSFTYGSLRCSVSKLPVLRHAIQNSFSSAPAPPFAWFHLFTNYHKYKLWCSKIQLLQDQQYVWICFLYWLYHCIWLPITMEIVKDSSHINQTQTISPVYFF